MERGHDYFSTLKEIERYNKQMHKYPETIKIYNMMYKNKTGSLNSLEETLRELVDDVRNIEDAVRNIEYSFVVYIEYLKALYYQQEQEQQWDRGVIMLA